MILFGFIQKKEQAKHVKRKWKRERYKLQQPETKSIWRWGASIPLPTACEAVALPFELHPPVRPLTSYGVIESNEKKKLVTKRAVINLFPVMRDFNLDSFPIVMVWEMRRREAFWVHSNLAFGS